MYGEEYLESQTKGEDTMTVSNKKPTIKQLLSTIEDEQTQKLVGAMKNFMVKIQEREEIIQKEIKNLAAYKKAAEEAYNNEDIDYFKTSSLLMY